MLLFKTIKIMKALVFNGPGKIIYEDFLDPFIEDNRNLIIKVTKCSICGSDLHSYHGDSVGPFDFSKPMEKFCTGHEMIGEVMEVGNAVRNHKVGDKILLAGGKGCGECVNCRSGKGNICTGYAKGIMMSAYGFMPALQGGHADFLQVHNADLSAVKIPDGVTDEQAVLMTDALATGYYGVKKAGVKPGDIVAVIGQGPVGLMAAEAAYASGASKVYTIEPNETRRMISKGFGAIPLAPEMALPTIIEDTGRIGVDAVIDAVGIAVTMQQALDLVKAGGRISILGLVQPGTPIPLILAQMKSITIHIGIAGVVDLWQDLLPLVQNGKIKGDNVFTHSFDLKDGAAAYKLFDEQADGVMKIIMTP
jgi:2-desacetyl-2-hydroxyethyl bacteriochlorophyllide A dehydrogenase